MMRWNSAHACATYKLLNSLLVQIYPELLKRFTKNPSLVIYFVEKENAV